jgi:hypothetical protein
MYAQTPQHQSEHAQQTIDPEFSPLACILADCQPEQLLAVAWRDDELVVIVAPGTKQVFTAQQIYDAGWQHGQGIGGRQIRAARAEPVQVTPHEITALEHVAAAHPGELAAAMINTARPTPAPFQQAHERAADNPSRPTPDTVETNRQAEAARTARETADANRQAQNSGAYIPSRATPETSPAAPSTDATIWPGNLDDKPLNPKPFKPYRK